VFRPARAIVGNLDDDRTALVEGAQRETAGRALAGGGARLRRLDAVIDAVADHVHQRVVHVLDDLAIEFGVLSRQRQLDRLAGALAQVADETRHLLERLANGHRAHRHRAALQLGRDATQLGEVARQLLVDNRAQRRMLVDERLQDDEFADGVDHAVQLARVDLHRGLRVAGVLRRGRRGGRGRCDRRGRRCWR
jgi:hypothetical protein